MSLESSRTGRWPKMAPPVLKAGQVPLCYRSEYNITAGGIERLHPFDSAKYGRIFKALKKKGLVSGKSAVAPPMLSAEELRASHSAEYLASLSTSQTIAEVTEIPPVAYLPHCLITWRVLWPMLYTCKGTIMASHFALQHGYGINLGGGYHHASRERGHGFCVYNDISQAIWSIRAAYGPKRIMILDLDAHQGDGHESDFYDDTTVYIYDVYTQYIFPRAYHLRKAIRMEYYFEPLDTGEHLLAKLQASVPKIVAEWKPDLVVYNAGSDILEGDPLSGLSITAENVIKRDEMVFRCCGYQPREIAVQRDAGAPSGGWMSKAASLFGLSQAPEAVSKVEPASLTIPPPPPLPTVSTHTAPTVSAPAGAGAGLEEIHVSAQAEETASLPGPPSFVPVVMLLSGGYQRKTADVISASIINLNAKFGILDPAWRAPAHWKPVSVPA